MAAQADLITISPNDGGTDPDNQSWWIFSFPDANGDQPDDIYDLPHEHAFIWGINLDNYLADNQIVETATIYFDNINNNEGGVNKLFIDLLDLAEPGSENDFLLSYNDRNDDLIDYFATNHEEGYGSVSQEVTYVDNNSLWGRDESFALNAGVINSYSADNGWIGIGLDPDCHFVNTGVRLELTTATRNVPESATLILMGISFLSFSGISFFRKRK